MEGTEKNPSKKTKREGKNPCQVGYCLGSVDMVQIPSGWGLATVLIEPLLIGPKPTSPMLLGRL